MTGDLGGQGWTVVQEVSIDRWSERYQYYKSTIIPTAPTLHTPHLTYPSVYRLIINDNLDTGTQLPYIREAMKRNYAVLILNTNLVSIFYSFTLLLFSLSLLSSILPISYSLNLIIYSPLLTFFFSTLPISSSTLPLLSAHLFSLSPPFYLSPHLLSISTLLSLSPHILYLYSPSPPLLSPHLLLLLPHILLPSSHRVTHSTLQRHGNKSSRIHRM